MSEVWEALVENAVLFRDGVFFAATWHMLFMVLLTCLATLLCAKGVLDFSFDTSMAIVAVGTIFPLVFSVQASFGRREKALSALGELKGTLFTVYLMFKCWDKGEEGSAAEEVDGVFQKLIADIIEYMRNTDGRSEKGHAVYDGFTELAVKMHEFIPKAGYSKPGEGGLSRMQQYLRDLITHFESVRAVRDTKTPVGLSLFCFALIHISPILLAPYWNHFCSKQSGGTDELPPTFGCVSGYFVGIFYVLIVLTLHRVQSELEDPFDGDGMDDIKWDCWSAQLDQLANYGEDGPAKREARNKRSYQLG